MIISYTTDGSDGVSPTSTGGTISTSAEMTIHAFTSSGTPTAVEAAGGTLTQNRNFFAYT